MDMVALRESMKKTRKRCVVVEPDNIRTLTIQEHWQELTHKQAAETLVRFYL